MKDRSVAVIKIEMAIKITIIGPLNIDYKTSIDFSPSDVLERFPTPYIKQSISKITGGKGYLAAKAAIAAGGSPYLIACVGGHNSPDANGRFLLDSIEAEHIKGEIRTCYGYNTAQVLLVYFRSNNPRLMICDNDVIFQLHLAPTDIEAIIESSKMIYVSGYLLLEEPSRSTVIDLLKAAKRKSVYSLLDVVPHAIVDHIEHDDLIEAASYTDVLVIAPATLDNLFPKDGFLSAQNHKELLPFLQKLRLGHMLAIMDKINGYLLLCTKDESKRIELGNIATHIPASGAGEYEILRVCLNHLSEATTYAVH